MIHRYFFIQASFCFWIQPWNSACQVVYLHACEQPTGEPISICEPEVHLYTSDIRSPYLTLTLSLTLSLTLYLTNTFCIRPNNDDIFLRPKDSKWLKGRNLMCLSLCLISFTFNNNFLLSS